MKAQSVDPATEKKGHVCPPSNATHPRDRWETAFVYSFICKFTQLRGKVEGLDTPMDLEEALLMPEATPIMTQVLSRFVLNLRPQTRNLGSDVISSTLAGILQEYLKSSERTIFWDDDLKKNIDPFQQMPDGFFAAEWDLKLRVLRQLVELQLCHSVEIKAIIDRAWGVVHNKHKKTETTPAPPPPSDPNSQENLHLLPIGQDKDRKRYWVVDDSPRLYMSTNPWKITATFQAAASTRDDYLAVVDKIRETSPPDSNTRRTKLEAAHLALLKVLEQRIEAIDAELARIQRAKRKIQQRNLLIAQAEMRETRTRRRTTRPDYAYMNDPVSDDDQDEYQYKEPGDEDYEDQEEEDDMASFRDPSTSSRRPAADSGNGRRRSTRTTNANGKRTVAPVNNWSEWRGERRSTRLGATDDMQLNEPWPKRARTEDSAVSTSSADIQSANAASTKGSALKIKISGAAAIKPSETAVEAVAGKKKSKYWYYAVEPVAGTAVVAPPPPPSEDAASASSYGHPVSSGKQMQDDASSIEHGSHRNGDTYKKSPERSLSATSSMDVS